MLSEELAFEACAELANEMLEKHGVSDRYTGEGLIEDFVGQNFRGIVSSLEKKYSLSMSDEERESYVKKEEGKPDHLTTSQWLVRTRVGSVLMLAFIIHFRNCFKYAPP